MSDGMSEQAVTFWVIVTILLGIGLIVGAMATIEIVQAREAGATDRTRALIMGGCPKHPAPERPDQP